MKLLATLLLMTVCGCDCKCNPRTTGTLAECQNKCGSLADVCVKQKAAEVCIDAYGKCVAYCAGDIPEVRCPEMQCPVR